MQKNDEKTTENGNVFDQNQDEIAEESSQFAEAARSDENSTADYDEKNDNSQ